MKIGFKATISAAIFAAMLNTETPAQAAPIVFTFDADINDVVTAESGIPGLFSLRQRGWDVTSQYVSAGVIDLTEGLELDITVNFVDGQNAASVSIEDGGSTINPLDERLSVELFAQQSAPDGTLIGFIDMDVTSFSMFGVSGDANTVPSTYSSIDIPMGPGAVAPLSALANYTNSIMSLTGFNIQATLTGIQLEPGQGPLPIALDDFARISILDKINVVQSGVPAPGALVLLSFGLLAVSVRRKAA